MARAIVITSGKGGVGKTTLTANMGRILASFGKKVVLIDADFGLNNLDVVMGVENRIVYDLADVVENRCRIKQALVADPCSDSLFVLPSVHYAGIAAPETAAVRAIVKTLKTRFDYILIDSPAGVDIGFHRAVSAADEAIVVTTPHVSALRDAHKVVRLLAAYEPETVSVVLNRVRGDLEKDGETVGVKDVEELMRVKVSGAIPEDDSINMLSATSGPIPQNSEGYQATEMLVKNLINGGGEVYDARRKYAGLFGKLRRSLRKIV